MHYKPSMEHQNSARSVTGGSDFVASSLDGSSSEHCSAVRRPSRRLSSNIVERRTSLAKLRKRSSVTNSTLTSALQPRKSMWNNLFKDDQVWDDEDEELSNEQLSTREAMRNAWISLQISAKEKLYVLKCHPCILLFTLIMFGGLTSIGLYGVQKLAEEQESTSRQDAYDLAIDTGAWFSHALDSTLLPLFTLSQFVQQLNMFAKLPEEIGPAFQPGSLPFLPPNQDGEYTHRNATGSICKDPDMVSSFADIASIIKKDANMEGVLVNLQVAPMGTVCLIYPLNNTEDFQPPKYFDYSNSVGHDLITDPTRKFIARETVLTDDVVIAGPLSLRQCPNCDVTVKTVLYVRMAVDAFSQNHVINIDGVDYKKWGFVIALINWAELVRRSDIDERFAIRGLRYQLTRTDRNYNNTTHEFDVTVNILAGEESFELQDSDFVSVRLDTTNNEWNIKVGKNEGFKPLWKNGAIAGTFVVAFVLSFMLMIICIENQTRHDLLREMLPRKALRKIRMGKTCVEKYDVATVFFCDIVGYTTMSAEMKAIQVMKMLNEFYTEVDKIATKHKVCKIQTIGDAYMVTGGVPNRCSGPEGAANVALFAIETVELAKNFLTSDGAKVIIRAGINSGPLVAGVVGTKRPQYTVFGDTVNLASRMESTSEKMRIQCSDMTYKLLRDSKAKMFEFDRNDEIEVRGKGVIKTWFINGIANAHTKPQSSSDNGEDTAEINSDLHLYGHSESP